MMHGHTNIKFWGFHTGEAKDFVLVESDAASLGSWILMLQGSSVLTFMCRDVQKDTESYPRRMDWSTS